MSNNKDTMKDKTLCLYWPQYDKVLNIRKVDSGIEFEIRTNRSEYIIISKNQTKEIKDWMKENGI